MSKKLFKVLLILGLSLGLASAVFAQVQTGSLHGTIYDNEGNALPGVTITISSPAMMGTKTYVTTDTGTFRFPSLPPGTYTISAEMPGFKTVKRGEIIVRVGMVVTVNISMEMTTLEEEVTVTAASPVVDVQQSKIAITMDKNLLLNIPLARDLTDVVMSAPGVVPSSGNPMVHGSTVRGNTYQIDGVGINNPAVLSRITDISYDIIDEVEMITGGHPAAVGYTDGIYVNVVTRSGGNRFSGGATLYYTNDSLSQSLWTDEQVTAMGVSQPAVYKRWIDGAVNLGGPIMRDRLWFFTNFQYIRWDRTTGFIPFTDILGRNHPPFDRWEVEILPFIKLTAQVTPSIKVSGMFQLRDRNQPIDGGSDFRSQYGYQNHPHDKYYTGSLSLNYVLDQNTFFDLKFGYVRQWVQYYLQDEVRDLPRIYDYGSPYLYLTNDRFEETYLRWRQQGGIHFTRFQDNFLSGNHEFKAGFEYENAYGDWDTWRQDNMLLYFDSREKGNYYYGTRTWKGVPNVGRGRIQFYTMGPEAGSSMYVGRIRRISAYIQDSVTFGRRLTLNLGLRFDRMWSWHPPQTKVESGNPLSVHIGETLIKPYSQEKWPDRFPNGINPWGELTYGGWDKIHTWNTLAPRIGFSFDVFGDGKTAVKGSFGRYSEYLMTQYLSSGVHVFAPHSYRFYWYDTNFNGWPDITDDYTIYSAPDLRREDAEFQKLKMDPNTVAPTNDELTLGVWQEIFKNFSVGLNFIYKNKRDILEDARYDPDTKEWWYHMDQATAKENWIPFTAIVPGTDDYPDQTVTFYVRSNDSPETFYGITNVPELKRKYWGLEFIFNKRMADGWQFSGSVTYGKAYGNIGGIWGESFGASGAADSANWWVNRDGRTTADRPLIIKLMGTAELPYRFILSAYFRHYSGEPWGRFANIRPPSSWCSEHNGYRDYYGVYIEPWDTRRERSEGILDVRLEKEFRIGNFGRIGAYIDVENIAGYSNVSVGRDDIYRYNPSGENVNEPGNVTLETNYKRITGISGLRTVKLSLRFSF